MKVATPGRDARLVLVVRPQTFLVRQRYRPHRLEHLAVLQTHPVVWLVSFMNYDLGSVDLGERTLQPLDNPFDPKVHLCLRAGPDGSGVGDGI
jgi:hypothetical protein